MINLTLGSKALQKVMRLHFLFDKIADNYIDEAIFYLKKVQKPYL